jgi:hypothetical protein
LIQLKKEVHCNETLKKMKFKLLILGLCIAVTISGTYSKPSRRFDPGSSGGSKIAGSVGDWFTSKQPVYKYTYINKGLNGPAHGWNGPYAYSPPAPPSYNTGYFRAPAQGRYFGSSFASNALF